MTLVCAPTAIAAAGSSPGVTLVVGGCGVRTTPAVRTSIRNKPPSAQAIAFVGAVTPPDRTPAPPKHPAQHEDRCNRISRTTHPRPFPLLPKGPMPEPRQ